MENDPLYQEGLKHFGLGEWTEAAACFSQLQASYPDDPRVKQFLDTAQLRSSASAKVPRRSAEPGTWLRRLSWIGVVIILLLVAGGVVLAYQTWVVPAQAENARPPRQRGARPRFRWPPAITKRFTYQTLLAEVPDDLLLAGIFKAQCFRYDQRFSCSGDCRANAAIMQAQQS
jgi:hypothetical protein